MQRPTKNVYLQVLRTVNEVCVPSLFLVTDTKKYVFNCPEGLQRVIMQKKLKLGRLESFFLTTHNWTHMGGLPGLGMTLRDIHQKGMMEKDKASMTSTTILKSNNAAMTTLLEASSSGTTTLEANNNASTMTTLEPGASTMTTLEPDTSTMTTIEPDTSMVTNSEPNASATIKDKDALEESMPAEEVLSQKGVTAMPDEKKDDEKRSKDSTDTPFKLNGFSTKTKKSVSKKDMPLEEKLNVAQVNNLRTANIFGPSGISRIFQSAKNFLRFSEDFQFDVREQLVDEEIYSDNEISVSTITINSCPRSMEENGDDVNSLQNEDVIITNSNVVCYACTLKPLPGKFDATKAKVLGVPKGKVRMTLVDGKSIVLENGTTVTPEDVLGPSTPGPMFLLVDCPSHEYLKTVCENTRLKEYASSAHLILHLAPRDVCDDNTYVEWTSQLSSSCRHVFLHNVEKKVIFESHHCLQYMLNNIDPDFFPLVDQSNNNTASVTWKMPTDVPIKTLENKDGILKNFSKIRLRELLNMYNMVSTAAQKTPKKTIQWLDESTETIIKYEELLALVRKVMDMKEEVSNEVNMNNKRPAVTECNAMVSPKKHHSSTNHAYPQVVTLGTGACMPSKYRNVSSTLVHLSNNKAVILDCGESTFSELCRHYGDDNVNDILSKVKLIFISHMHPDHHLGLLTLISQYNKIFKTSINILAPFPLLNWLKDYASVNGPLSFNFRSCRDKGFSDYEGFRAQSIKVDHPGVAFGLVLYFNEDNTKITYSGDTMPCQALVEAGMNSDLLIHEATLDDELETEAAEKRHSTTRQALQVSRDMNANCVLLTHISQRYPKIPVFNEEPGKQVAFAFDHMEVTLDRISKFTKLVPSLNALFTEEEKPEEE